PPHASCSVVFSAQHHVVAASTGLCTLGTLITPAETPRTNRIVTTDSSTPIEQRICTNEQFVYSSLIREGLIAHRSEGSDLQIRLITGERNQQRHHQRHELIF